MVLTRSVCPQLQKRCLNCFLVYLQVFDRRFPGLSCCLEPPGALKASVFLNYSVCWELAR